MRKQTREPQYQDVIDLAAQKGLTSLGLMTNQVYHDDPRRLAFILARYKFVAKMLSGKKRALEVGCGDAFGTRLVLQELDYVCCVDFDPVFVEDVKSRMETKWRFDCFVHDFVSGPIDTRFDAAYAIDVLEHIHPDNEDKFLSNIVSCLSTDGVMILGTPSLQSQAYASPQSKAGHINCKDHRELKELMLRFFHNVFIFSMNDEMVHTGFYPMASFLFALGVCPQKH
jgi:cyclopropane fatty-acyl-phospholipid synthase-like methyltransferase